MLARNSSTTSAERNCPACLARRNHTSIGKVTIIPNTETPNTNTFLALPKEGVAKNLDGNSFSRAISYPRREYVRRELRRIDGQRESVDARGRKSINGASRETATWT